MVSETHCVGSYNTIWKRPVGYTGPCPVVYLPFEDADDIILHRSTITTGKVNCNINIYLLSRNNAVVIKVFEWWCFEEP